MKIKTILLFCILTYTPQLVDGQAAILAAIFGDQVASEKFNLSLELGVPFTGVTNIDHLSKESGVNFGIAGNIKLSDKWFLSPSAYFASRKSFTIKNSNLNTTDDYLNSLYQNVDATYFFSYIDIPIFIHYRIKDKFELGIAPQMSFRQKATATYEGTMGDYSESVSKHVERNDYGVVFSLGHFFKYGSKGNGLHVYARYYQGMKDVLKDDAFPGDNRNNYFSVLFSLPFLTVDKAYENYKIGRDQKAEKKAEKKARKKK